MKRAIFLFIAILGIGINSIAQQVVLRGVVTVQNSKTYTGKTQYVKGAEVEHINAKDAKTKDVTGNDGKFSLNIRGLQPNSQTQITVYPKGEYNGYVVVNEKELQSITLGRVTPVGIYICKKGELEQRRAEMVGVNMRKYEERMEKDKKRLQKELEELKSKNDYLNVRYGEIKDSLDIISKNIDNVFERIKEYAQSLTLENLDDRDENYVKAYECFSRGELDSVSYYLPEHELDLKHKKILQLQEEAKREKELAQILNESAKTKEEYADNSKNELIKEWLLLARTANMQNDYEKTMLYYEKVTDVDTLNVDNLFEYAYYLDKIKEYNKSELYYVQCLKIYRGLAADNPKAYLPGMAATLHNLAILHSETNEFSEALKEFEEALKIYRGLAADNPKAYLSYVATTLNNLANLHRYTNEFSEALKEYEEALKIYRGLAADNPKAYLPDVAMTLNNLAILHYATNEFSEALKEYEEALKIYRGLAADNLFARCGYDFEQSG